MPLKEKNEKVKLYFYSGAHRSSTYGAYCLISLTNNTHTDVYLVSSLMASNSEREYFYINQKDRSGDSERKKKGKERNLGWM
jgi:hypothetical protein